MTNSSFKAPKSGYLNAVELHHVSGYVTSDAVNYPEGGNFGRRDAYLDVQLIREYPMTATEETLFPNYDIEGVTSIGALVSPLCTTGRGCSVWYYFMTGYEANSDVLRWDNSLNPTAISINETFSLQFGEGCCGYAQADNAGVSCADVYFEYESFGMLSVFVVLCSTHEYSTSTFLHFPSIFEMICMYR